MASWLSMARSDLPNGKSIHILLDLSDSGANNYAVVCLLNGRVYSSVAGLDWSTAKDLAEENELISGPGYDTGWRAVLERLRGNIEPMAVVHDIAALYFPAGTWNWLVVTSRMRQKATGEPHENKQGRAHRA